MLGSTIAQFVTKSKCQCLALLSNHRRPTGSDYKRFRQQLEALTSSRMTVNDRTQDRLKGHRFTLADSWQIDLAQHLIQ